MAFTDMTLTSMLWREHGLRLLLTDRPPERGRGLIRVWQGMPQPASPVPPQAACPGADRQREAGRMESGTRPVRRETRSSADGRPVSGTGQSMPGYRNQEYRKPELQRNQEYGNPGKRYPVSGSDQRSESRISPPPRREPGPMGSMGPAGSPGNRGVQGLRGAPGRQGAPGSLVSMAVFPARVFGQANLCTLLWKDRGLRYLLQPAQGPGNNVAQDDGSGTDASLDIASRTDVARNTVFSVTRRQIQDVEPSGPVRTAETVTPVQMPAVTIRREEDWPPLWKSFLTRVKPGKLVWTYPELCDDLQGRESAGRDERRAFLNRILGVRPSFPVGTHTFWPCCVRDGDGLVPDAELFWSGVRLLGARLVCFLSEQMGGLFLDRDLLNYRVVQGITCLVCPDISGMQQNLFDVMYKEITTKLANLGVYAR